MRIGPWIVLVVACGRIDFDPLARGTTVDGSMHVDSGTPVTPCSGGFTAAQTYPAGSDPVGIAAGEIDGDGVVDLVAVDDESDTGTASILRGLGHGTFASPTSILLGDEPEYVALVDVDHDGKLDLLTTINFNLSVQLGDGTGAFGSGATFGTGGAGYPIGIAAGDIDGDGNIDVVAPPLDSQIANVLLGDGTGNFTPVMFQHDGFPEGIAVADLDGDGRADLALPNTAPELEVFLSKGSGAFSSTPFVSSGGGLVVVADVDRDGKPDLIDQDGSGTLGFVRGTGGGAFADAVAIPIGTDEAPSSIALADVDGDGLLDLVTTQKDSNTATLLLGHGDGTFGAPQTYPVSDPTLLVVRDLDGDGHPDLATTDRNNNDVDVLLWACN